MGEKGPCVFLPEFPRRLPFPLRPDGQLARPDQHPLVSFARPSVPGESSFERFLPVECSGLAGTIISARGASEGVLSGTRVVSATSMPL